MLTDSSVSLFAVRWLCLIDLHTFANAMICYCSLAIFFNFYTPSQCSPENPYNVQPS